MKLKPCPFCGFQPDFGETPEGGVFLECQGCRASSAMMFPEKCDVRGLLAEKWNTRHRLLVGAEQSKMRQFSDDDVARKVDEQVRDHYMNSAAIQELLFRFAKLRKILAHIPGRIQIEAKEAAGYGDAIKPMEVQ